MTRFGVLLASFTLVAAFASSSMAFPLCDDHSKYTELYDSMIPYQKAFRERRFAELDRQMSALLAAQAQGTVSDQVVHRWFLRLFSGRVSDETVYDDWMSAYPDSQAALLAAAYGYSARGWAGRGGEFASKTSRSQFDAMAREFGKSLSLLDKADRMRKTSLSAALRLDMLVGMSAIDADELHSRYERAILDFPRSLQLRVIYLNKAPPKWGGSLEQLRAVEDHVASLSPDDRRYVRYLMLEALGEASELAGDKAKSAGYYEQAMPLCPGLGGAAAKAIFLYVDTRNYEFLIRAADRYIALNPLDGWGYAKRGWAHEQMQRWSESLRDDQKSAELGYGEGYRRLAWHYEMGLGVKRDPAKAIELYEIAYAHGITDARAQAAKLRRASGTEAR